MDIPTCTFLLCYNGLLGPLTTMSFEGSFRLILIVPFPLGMSVLRGPVGQPWLHFPRIPCVMGRDWLSGGVKGAVLAESQCRDFLVWFQEQAAASQLACWEGLAMGTSLPHCWDYQDSSKTHGGLPGRQETTWLRDFAVLRALGTSTSMGGCREGLPDMGQTWDTSLWDTSLWAVFSSPTLDCSDMGHWKAASVEGLA